MAKTKKYDFIIGIDPGVNTGYAVWSCEFKRLWVVETWTIHKTLFIISNSCKINKLLVRFEDARKRKWFGNAGRDQLQGAGSIKRDCKIWEDFLTDVGVDFEMIAPKNIKTKTKSDYFKKITGWEGRTSEHSRDAAMLVFNYN